MIDPELLRLLACATPTCRGALVELDGCLVCQRCGLRYRIEEKWPVLIPEEAQPPATAAAQPRHGQ